MKKHSILLVAALVAIALAATACSKTETNANNSNSTTNTSKSSNTTTTTNTSTPTATGASTPTGAFKAIYEAAKNKDVAGFKKNLASADIKSLEEITKTDGKSADDFLKEMLNSPESKIPPTLETRNEKIDGDKATLESKKQNGDWETIYLIKEGGEWKVRMAGDKDEAAGEPKKSEEHGGDH